MLTHNLNVSLNLKTSQCDWYRGSKMSWLTVLVCHLVSGAMAQPLGLYPDLQCNTIGLPCSVGDPAHQPPPQHPQLLPVEPVSLLGRLS